MVDALSPSPTQFVLIRPGVGDAARVAKPTFAQLACPYQLTAGIAAATKTKENEQQKHKRKQKYS